MTFELNNMRKTGADKGKTGVMGKLREKRGSSMIFALLITLVCIVVSSVIITAGTAAAGRLVKTAEADRRYYAVSSAVEMLRDMFDDQSIEIIWTRTAYQSRKYVITVDEDDNPNVSDEDMNDALRTIHQVMRDEDGTYYTRIDYESDEVSTPDDLLMAAVLDVTLGTNRTELDEEERKTFLDTVWIDSTWQGNVNREFVQASTQRDLVLTLDGADEDDDLTVYVTYLLQEDGTFTLTVASDRDVEGTDPNDIYSVCMTFRPMIDDEIKIGIPYETDTQDPVASVDAGGHSVITQYYDRTTAYERDISYRWVLSNITTISAGGTQAAGGQQQIPETN